MNIQLLDEWRDYFGEQSRYCEQTHLTADTNGIIVEFLEKKIQEAHLDRMEYFRSVLLQTKTIFVDSEMGVTRHLQQKIDNDTNIIKMLIGKEKIEINPEDEPYNQLKTSLQLGSNKFYKTEE